MCFLTIFENYFGLYQLLLKIQEMQKILRRETAYHWTVRFWWVCEKNTSELGMGTSIVNYIKIDKRVFIYSVLVSSIVNAVVYILALGYHLYFKNQYNKIVIIIIWVNYKSSDNTWYVLLRYCCCFKSPNLTETS